MGTAVVGGLQLHPQP